MELQDVLMNSVLASLYGLSPPLLAQPQCAVKLEAIIITRDVIRCLGEMASIVFLTLSIYGLIWWFVGLGEERNRMEGDLYIGLIFSTLCNFTINTLYIIIIKMM